jgi:hypothetical protein
MRISGAKCYEVTGDWRKLHNEELHNLYSSRSTIRGIKSRGMGRAYSTKGAFVGRPEKPTRKTKT